LRAALKERLNGSLFTEPSDRAPLSAAWIAAIAALLALGVVLQLLRLSWGVSFDSLWAEDGSVFLHDGLSHGLIHNVVTPYMRYIVLVPRLIGQVAGLAGLGDAPGVFSVLSACFVSLSGLAVWYGSEGHIRAPYLRAGLAALVVIAPVSGLEALDAAAYVSWYMLFASFWLLIWRPQTTRGSVAAGAFILITALSNPGIWFFAPIAVLRGLAARDRRDATIVSAWVLGSAIQFAVTALSHQAVSDPSWTTDILPAYVQRVLAGGPLGLNIPGELWKNLHWVALGPLAAIFAAGLARGARRSTSGGRIFVIIAVATSAGMFVISAYQRAVGSALLWPEGSYTGTSSRYAIVPALLLLSAGLVLLDIAMRRSQRGPGWTAIQAGVLALLLAGAVASFDQRDLALRGTPAWGDALAGAAQRCRAQPQLAEIPIPTSPTGFTVTESCADIAAAAPD